MIAVIVMPAVIYDYSAVVSVSTSMSLSSSRVCTVNVGKLVKGRFLDIRLVELIQSCSIVWQRSR